MPFWKRKPSAVETKTLWLVKDDPDAEWYCKCPQGIVNAPYHDKSTFPAGGTGWLFVCCKCSRAFMFARAAYIRPSLQDLAQQLTPRVREVMDAKSGAVRSEVLIAGPEDWLAVVQPLAAQLELGQRYVFFDGAILPAQRGRVKFPGVWREHDLLDLPHLGEGPLRELLTDPTYWCGPESPEVS